MENVWESQLFASLSELVDAVNERGLTADRFKVVPEPSASGRGVFHLVYLTGAAPDPLISTLATAAEPAQGTTNLNDVEEQFEAVDEAESIIRDNQNG